MSSKQDLLIIGGGVLGAFHAYHAAQRGLRVQIIERHRAPSSASVRNFGQVVPSGMNPEWQRYGRASLELYKSIQDKFDLSVVQNGSLYIASDEDEMLLLQELHAINEAEEYESQLWTAEQCRTRLPSLRSDYVVGGLNFPQEISVNPRKMVSRLLAYLAEEHRVQVDFETCICDLQVSAKGVKAIDSDSRVFEAERAIVCCGNEFQLLFPDVFRASDLQVSKLQMLRLVPQVGVQLPGNILTGLSIRRYESFSGCPSWAQIKDREDDEAAWKKWGVHILLKQELDGSVIVGDSHEYAHASAQDDLGFDINHQINDYILEEAKRIVDLPSWNVASSWFGLYSQTNHPSGVFTTTIEDRIHVVTGIGGKGMSSSAGFAERSIKGILND